MKKLIFPCVALLLSSCSSLHPTVPAVPTDTASQDELIKLAGPAPASTIKGIKRNVLIYIGLYTREHTRLKKSEFVNGDLSLTSGTVGVIGGALKSTQAAIAGALGVSGSSMVKERYKIETQSLNYMKGMKAFQCINIALAPANQDLFNVDSKDDQIRQINTELYRVHSKLYESQSEVTLANPDISTLSDALDEFNKDKDAEHPSGFEPELVDLNKVDPTEKDNVEDKNAALILKQERLDKIKLIIDEIKTCRAQF